MRLKHRFITYVKRTSTSTSHPQIMTRKRSSPLVYFFVVFVCVAYTNAKSVKTTDENSLAYKVSVKCKATKGIYKGSVCFCFYL